VVDFYELLLQDEHLKGMFENWGYDDKIIVSRCNDLLYKIKSHLYTFNYESVKEGVSKDITFNDACINDIVQIRKLLSMLPKSHLSSLQTLGIIVVAPEGVNSKPFIPFNDIVIKNMEKVFDDILGQYKTKRNEILANSTLKTMIRGICFEENKQLVDLKERLLDSVETKNVNMIKDCVNLIIQTLKLEYHLQRCEVETYYEFTKDKAAQDSISYTLQEAIKGLERSCEETKEVLKTLEIDMKRLIKPHVLIVQKGMSPYDTISENYYLEELWEQIKILNKLCIKLSEIILG
jgi:hypothetical protein